RRRSALQRPREAPNGLLQAARRLEGGRRLEAGMDAAMLAARIVARAVRVPLHSLEQRFVRREDPVREEIAGAFPAVRVACDRSPRGARQLALAGEEVLVDRSGEPAVALLADCGADGTELH